MSVAHNTIHSIFSSGSVFWFVDKAAAGQTKYAQSSFRS